MSASPLPSSFRASKNRTRLRSSFWTACDCDYTDTRCLWKSNSWTNVNSNIRAAVRRNVVRKLILLVPILIAGCAQPKTVTRAELDGLKAHRQEPKVSMWYYTGSKDGLSLLSSR